MSSLFEKILGVSVKKWNLNRDLFYPLNIVNSILFWLFYIASSCVYI